MRRAIGGALLAACLMTGVAAAEPALLPRPVSDVATSGSFTVSAATPIEADPHDKAAIDAAARFAELVAQSGAVAVKTGKGDHAIRFVTDKKIKGAEAYRLTVTPTGILVSASHPAGLFYGAVTLWQLLTADPGNGPVTLSARTIDDAPRFAWRGLLLDSARHFQSAGYIKRYIDWMAELKLNVLHWHLVDDQGWRIEIKHYPKLTQVGAYVMPAGQAEAADIDPATGKPRLTGGFYSQAEIKEIVAYAMARHVTILPEIEMPGHSTAAIAAYPQFGVAPEKVDGPSHDWGVLYNLYNVDDATFTFIETVLTEVMALFPSRYIHVGGDEAVKKQWHDSPAVQAKMKALGIKDEEAMQSWFIGRIEKFLESHGRHLIGWDEILQGGVTPHATVMSWRGMQGALTAARAGHDTVLAPAPDLYLDNRQSGSPNEPPGRGTIITVQSIYNFQPAPPELTPAERAHILGLQAALWTEHVRTEDFATRMTYPRAAALAEVGWSTAGSLNWDDFSSRLAVERVRYARVGLQDDQPAPKSDPSRIYSQELTLCKGQNPLSLEDDAPLDGPRARFLVDIGNPCWQLKQADLSQKATLIADVGQVPYNFQFGDGEIDYRPHPPRGPQGELEVRADSCEGEPIAALSLAPAAGNFATTTLKGDLPTLPGKHDLCFIFAVKSKDPLWAINWIKLDSAAAKP
jgi:hexosaminidase